MAVSLKHTTQATGTDAGNGEIRKAQWNEEHTLTLATARLLGRTTAGTGAAEEISVGSGLSLAAGSLSVNLLASNISGFDSAASKYSVKADVVAATTANITLSGTQTIDGVSVVANDRVLVKNQTVASDNGIYAAATGAWTRVSDANDWQENQNALVIVSGAGTVNGGTTWLSSASPQGALGTNGIFWNRFVPTDNVNNKVSVAAATTANITLSGTQTVDGVALVANNSVLVKNQTTSSQNGIYIVQSGSWTRFSGMNAWSDVANKVVRVSSGTVNANTEWVSSGPTNGTLDTSAITWTSLLDCFYATGSGQTVRVFTVGGVYRPSPGTRWITVYLTGGGGGGGYGGISGTTLSYCFAASGGGGATTIFSMPMSSAQTAQISIGAAGTAGTSSTVLSGNGGTTTFTIGGQAFSAFGGVAGNNNTATGYVTSGTPTSPIRGTGGAAASAPSGAQLYYVTANEIQRIAGRDAGIGWPGTTGPFGISAPSGGSFWAPGLNSMGRGANATTATTFTALNAGTSDFGVGGAGMAFYKNTTTNVLYSGAGGTGGPGICVIIEYRS